MGLAQAVLAQRQYYIDCVPLGSATASGKAAVAYKSSAARRRCKPKTIMTAKNFCVGSNGIWYLCSGYYALPGSPGAATLTGTVTYTPTAGKAVLSKLSVPVLLQ